MEGATKHQFQQKAETECVLFCCVLEIYGIVFIIMIIFNKKMTMQGYFSSRINRKELEMSIIWDL